MFINIVLCKDVMCFVIETLLLINNLYCNNNIKSVISRTCNVKTAIKVFQNITTSAVRGVSIR